jgi:hypothetical protein
MISDLPGGERSEASVVEAVWKDGVEEKFERWKRKRKVSFIILRKGLRHEALETGELNHQVDRSFLFEQRRDGKFQL